MTDDLNLDDMRPYSYIATMLPQEYEAEFKRLRAENDRLTRKCLKLEDERDHLQSLLEGYMRKYASLELAAQRANDGAQ